MILTLKWGCCEIPKSLFKPFRRIDWHIVAIGSKMLFSPKLLALVLFGAWESWAPLQFYWIGQIVRSVSEYVVQHSSWWKWKICLLLQKSKGLFGQSNISYLELKMEWLYSLSFPKLFCTHSHSCFLPTSPMSKGVPYFVNTSW